MTAAAEAIQVRPKPTSDAALVWFEECDKHDVERVGGKCSSLGELIHMGVRVPPGFAITTAGCTRFLQDAGILDEIDRLLQGIDAQDIERLEQVSSLVRGMIESRPMAIELQDEIAAP